MEPECERVYFVRSLYSYRQRVSTNEQPITFDVAGLLFGGDEADFYCVRFNTLYSETVLTFLSHLVFSFFSKQGKSVAKTLKLGADICIGQERKRYLLSEEGAQSCQRDYE